MADTDRDELDRTAVFYLGNDLSEMALKIVSDIHAQRGIVDWRPVRNHHQYLALFRAAEQSVMCPEQRFAVDIFLQKPLTHHQAEILPRPAPWSIRRLVNDVAQVIQAPRASRLVRLDPVLPGQAAFPGLGCKAQNLHLDAATLQRAGQYVGAECRNHDRAAAHGTGIVQQ